MRGVLRAVALVSALWSFGGQSSTLLAQNLTSQLRPPAGGWPAAREIDKSRLVRNGFRVLEGRHATIVTDLVSTPAIDALPRVIDAAVPLFAALFGLEQSTVDDWRVLVMLIDDRERFAAQGLMPEGNEGFPDGLSMGHEVWIARQPSDYYRRHLLLHELTHSFMATRLYGCGPGWYMEGMAELLGTHAWRTAPERLTLGVMPQRRAEVPMWGRTSLIRGAVADQRLLSISQVLRIDNRRLLDVESYAWVWALAKFLDTHPHYQGRFRVLQRHVRDPDFTDRFRDAYEADWRDLNTEWRLFAGTLDYGHDIEREAIEFVSARPVTGSARTSISADRGWQSTGWRLDANQEYELRASGRFVVGAEPDGTPWPCEPGGITLAYHAGYPLGMLVGAVDDRPVSSQEVKNRGSFASQLLHPQPLGPRATLAPSRAGVLFLRVNDLPSRLAENRGSVSVAIRRLPRRDAEDVQAE